MRIFNIQKLFRGGKGKMHYLFLLFTIVTLLTVLPAIGFAQSFTSINEQPTSWDAPATWTGSPSASFLAGNPDVSGSNITIQGTVNTVGSLTISTNVQLFVDDNDTLIINGNLSIVSGGSLTLFVRSGSYFFLLGDFDIQSGGGTSFDLAGGGFFGVRGNYTENGTATGGLNSSTEYIIGTVIGTHISSSSATYPSGDFHVVGNRDALIAQADPSTRKILLGVQALGASCAVSSAITCNGGTGAITATASGGSYKYQYRLSDGVNPDIYYPDASSYTSDVSHTFSGLTQNLYTIYVLDDDGDESSCAVTLSEPDLLAVSVGGSSQDWSCASSPGCNGALNLIITGGTAPYAITGTAANVPGNSFTSTNASNGSLCADSYTINVKDANVATCPTSDITLPVPFEVSLDNAAPTGCNVPANEFLSLADYNTLVSTINLPVQSHIFPSGNNLNQTFTFSGSSHLIDRTLNLTILREGSGWDVADVITVDTSYNGGTNYTQAFSVTGGTDVIPTTLTLNNSAVDVLVRVTVTTGIGRNFNVTDIHVSGDGVPVDLLFGCTDNPGQTITQSYSATINWLCANEFVVTRSWSVADGCNNSGSYAQTIAVGEYPTFTGTAQTYTYDFCHPNQTITCPTFTDGCDPAPTVSYVIIDDVTTAQFNAGTGSPFTYSFPVPTQNDTVYTVRWTVTDQAGFSTSIIEKVNIRRPMQITLTPVAGDDDFCTGEEVNFNVSVVGGTGAYAQPTFTPAPISWNSSDGNVSGLYTTNGLIWNSGAGTPIVINYTDTDYLGVTGGCSTPATFNNGSGFTVHPNITTNGISRMP
jgi:hypothetical protein